MEFAVNYSPALAELVQSGQIALDRFKCPDWPDLYRAALRIAPVYLHFNLSIGSGVGMPLDGHARNQPANLDNIARMADETGTPCINTHLFPRPSDYPDQSPDSLAPADVRRVIDAALRDLEPLLTRFGPENVLVEMGADLYIEVAAATHPPAVCTLLQEAGCGYLFDLSHACMTCLARDIDPVGYIEQLPLKSIREVHLTGLGKIEGEWYDYLRRIGDPRQDADKLRGRWMDHLPMRPEDWPLVEWSMARIHAGEWGQPWVTALEVGGVGGFWEPLSTPAMYLRDLPRLRSLIYPPG